MVSLDKQNIILNLFLIEMIHYFLFHISARDKFENIYQGIMERKSIFYLRNEYDNNLITNIFFLQILCSN